MSKSLAAGLALAVSLLAIAPAAAQPLAGNARPGCEKLFTPAMDRRAAQAVYRGTRTASHRNLELLGMLERCQVRRPMQAVVRSYNRRMGELNRRRREPPTPAAADGWVIPASIVACESHGQNLAPNSEGASGYYQIIPSTWAAYGGTRYASQAYEATKGEQDAIAARIWDGGRGAGQWVCKA